MDYSADGGTLFVCGYGHKHKVDSKFREEDLIQPTDFEDIKESFDLVKYYENQVEGKFFVTYIFRKTSRWDKFVSLVYEEHIAAINAAFDRDNVYWLLHIDLVTKVYWKIIYQNIYFSE
ncbi:hypothetical protein [Clostridium thermarum]|uniref:hypothetical protein n=1 Tax=Clostridium thermarum TaxID=1716543 RepID=UPI00111CCF89|nr:hypothetical protein [Clostridium thermarum]